MGKVAIIEDDPPTSDQFRKWITSARPDLQVDQWFSRDDAEAAVLRESYDVVVLDIELGKEKNAGIAVINTINKKGGTSVLVVSGLPSSIYRGVMKALDAWEYLQKSTFEEPEFVETLLGMLRLAQMRKVKEGAPPALDEELEIDVWKASKSKWKGKRLGLPSTPLRILSRIYKEKGKVVSYKQLFEEVETGKNEDNIRQHVAKIRKALREIDPDFDRIRSIPMVGVVWTMDKGSRG